MEVEMRVRRLEGCRQSTRIDLFSGRVELGVREGQGREGAPLPDVVEEMDQHATEECGGRGKGGGRG